MFHGWKVVAAAFVVALFGWGLGFYGVGVFVAALGQRHGWSAALISSAVTFYYMLGATLILFLGTAFERWGPRSVVLGGACAMAAGALVLTTVTAPWQLYPAFGLMALGWAGMSGAAVNLIVAPWFERRRGLAVSLAFNGASFGGITVAPVLLLAIAHLGYQTGVALACLLMAVLLGPPVTFWLHRGPAALGLLPDGDAPAVQPTPARPVEPPPGRRTFLRGWAFWSVSLPFAFGLMAQVGFLTHQVAFLLPSLGAGGVSLALGLTTAAAIAGRFVVGLVVDRVPRRQVAAANFLVQTAALGLLLFGAGTPTLYLSCVLFGLGVGNMVSLPGLIVQAEFPRAAFARIVTTLVAINQFTFSVGPSLVGALRDWRGDYSPALAVCMALLLLASGLVLCRKAARAEPAPAR